MPPVPKQPTTTAPPAGSTGFAAGAGGAAAGAGLGVVTTAGLEAPLIAAGAVGQEAVEAGTQALVAAFRRALRRRRTSSARSLLDVLRDEFPEESEDDLRRLVREELDREDEFQSRMLDRLRRDLPAAFEVEDPVERARRVQVIVDRERRYIHAREEAMAERAFAAIERMTLRRVSPLGALWMLGDDVAQHTLDCVAMAGHFWPWEVLNEIHPPLHHGCACYLVPFGEAVERGLMYPDQIPDTRDAIRRARSIAEQYGLLREAVQDWEVDAYVTWLQEADTTADFPEHLAAEDEKDEKKRKRRKRVEEAYDPRLHPKDRLGRWLETPDAPKRWKAPSPLVPMRMANTNVDHPRYQRFLNYNPSPPTVFPMNAAQRAGLRRVRWNTEPTMFGDLGGGDLFSTDGHRVYEVTGVGSVSGWAKLPSGESESFDRRRQVDWVLRKGETPVVYSPPPDPYQNPAKEPWQETFDEFAADPRTLWHGTLWGTVGEGKLPLVHVGTWHAAHDALQARVGDVDVPSTYVVTSKFYVWTDRKTGESHGYPWGGTNVERLPNPYHREPYEVHPAMVPVRVVGKMAPGVHSDFVGDRKPGDFVPENVMKGILARGQKLSKGYLYKNEAEGVETDPFGNFVYSTSAVVPDEDWLWTHEDFVRDALKRGEPVPDEVLKEYGLASTSSPQAVLDEDQGRDLEGLPGAVKVPSLGPLEFHSFGLVQDIAEKYRREHGIDTPRSREYVKVDPVMARRYAREYDRLKHDPDDPKVKASYEAMTREVRAQYDALVDAGFTFEFYPPGEDPYPNSPREAILDLHRNRHMYVYPTEDGYGSEDEVAPDHPMLVDSGIRWGDKPVTVNDLFRAVHDVFGHAKEGVGFRADGEDNAWRSHASMFSREALPAMTAETRGQNSWVNFGPHGKHNRTAGQADTVFAPQKAVVMPQWAMT